MTRVLAVTVLLALAARAWAADPPWVAAVEALLAKPGQGAAALAQLDALPLSDRQSQAWHGLVALAAQAAGRPALAAEAAAVATLLLPGPTRDLTGVRHWLSVRSRQAQARALATLPTSPPQAVRFYLEAVKADGAVLADDDRGLRATSLRELERAAAVAPNDPAPHHELAWHLYFQGEDARARRAFERARDTESDPYRKWRSQLWIDRIDRAAQAARAEDAARDTRRAAERAADDKRRAEEDAASAKRAKARAEEDARAAREAARARRREISTELMEIDRRIRTLRERRMIRVTPGDGLSAQGIYNYLSELKAEEDAENEKKRKLIEERDSLGE